MSVNQTATDTMAPEAVAFVEKHYPPTGSHGVRKRKNAISGPTRFKPGRNPPRKRIFDRKSPYPPSRFERARAPSPPARSCSVPDVPDWPADFCLFMDCDITVQHGHTKKEIRERIGYDFWMDNLFQPAWSRTDDSEEYDGLLRARPSDMKGSSLLNSKAKGTNDLRDALPSILKGSSIINPDGNGAEDLREALPTVKHVVKEKQAGKHGLSSADASAVTIDLEKLAIWTWDQSKP